MLNHVSSWLQSRCWLIMCMQLGSSAPESVLISNTCAVLRRLTKHVYAADAVCDDDGHHITRVQLVM